MLTISLAQAQTTVTETFTDFKNNFGVPYVDGWSSKDFPYTSGVTGYDYFLNGYLEIPGRRNEGGNPMPGSIRGRAGEVENDEPVRTFLLKATDLPGGVTSITVHTAAFWGTSSTVLRSVKIFVNGEDVGTSPGKTSQGTGDAGDNTLGYADFTVNNLDIDGAFSLDIEAVCTTGDCAGDKPNIAMAQLSWTTKTTLSSQDNVLASGLSVYPNPVSDVLNIKKLSNNVTFKNVVLYDIVGKVVYESNDTQSIHVRDFAKGLYLLKIESQEGGVLNRKILVK
ncbi:hypothetical protein GCM10007028_19220 [Algibacter mikhailovii]|uniref:Secretion system C-terminal sorting domain-containing protein n=2 Tax=Algibacter mikhailovii TaxID=425498 RepID=A0A918QZX5_9FLAO|nr:hypothetical protein GCM10007028_19220 [Algibacter mikhailovii]